MQRPELFVPRARSEITEEARVKPTRARLLAMFAAATVVVAVASGLGPASATDNLADSHWHKLGSDPVPYRIHDGLSDPGIAGAINAGAAEWTSPTNWDLSYGGFISGSVNYDDNTTHIVWAGDIPQDWQNGCPPSTTVACARWVYVVDFGVPHNIDADFVYASGNTFSTSNLNCDLGSTLAYDWWTVGAHEFGHWASLAHSSDILAVMYGPYTVCKRTLTQHDIDSANLRYAGH